MVPNTVIVAMAEISHEVETAPDDLVAKLKAAMKAARQSWIARGDDEQFRAAVGAVMQHYGVGSPEFQRLEAEMKNVQMISAMLQAAMAGLGVHPPEIDDSFEPVGLLDLWHKSKEES